MTAGEDAYTFAVALSYAIAALERCPHEWLKDGEREELESMRRLFERLVPYDDYRDTFMEVAESVLTGTGKPFDRPKLIHSEP